MDQKTVLALIVGALVLYAVAHQDDGDDTETIGDEIMNKFDEVAALVTGPGPNANMVTSQAAKRMMRASESCRLTPYNLGDGGLTIGWGHQYTRFETVAASITQAQADAMFESDVVTRGESKVKLYVSLDLDQSEFDALVDISYGLSVKGFRKFAAQVNAGNGIDDIAAASIAWVAPIYANGIRNRRNRQLAMYNEGQYS